MDLRPLLGVTSPPYPTKIMKDRSMEMRKVRTCLQRKCVVDALLNSLTTGDSATKADQLNLKAYEEMEA